MDTMKNISILRNTAAAAALAFVLAGCGSSGQTVPLERHAVVTDSLQRESTAVKMQNGSLNARILTLENEKRLHLTRIADLESTVTFLKSQIAKAPAAVPPAVDPGVGYQHALELFRGKQYAEAAQAFESLLAGGVDQKLRDNCRYWLGECLFGSKQYNKAIEHFRQVLEFEKSEKKDESQMMVARSYAAMGNGAQAKTEYQKLIDTFPASPYRKRAEAQMTRFK